MTIIPNKNLSSADFVAEIIKDVSFEDKLNVRGLGFFRLKKVASRVGRNPKTGEKIQVPSYVKIVFKAAKAFRDLAEAKAK